MRRGLHLVIFAVLAGGCATHQQTTAIQQPYAEAPSSALAFDLPMDRDIPHPELARAGRGQAAFMGFEMPTTESYITATDSISTELGDFHIQESVVVRSGGRVR